MREGKKLSQRVLCYHIHQGLWCEGREKVQEADESQRVKEKGDPPSASISNLHFD